MKEFRTSFGQLSPWSQHLKIDIEEFEDSQIAQHFHSNEIQY